MSWVLKNVLPVSHFESYAIYGSDIYVASSDNSIMQWYIPNAQITSVLKGGHHGKITAIVYCEQWKCIFSCALDGTFCVWFSNKLIGTFLNREQKSDPLGVPLYPRDIILLLSFTCFCWFSRGNSCFSNSLGFYSKITRY